VGRLRSLRRVLLVLLLAVCALLSLALIASQVEQHLFRRRAEQLLSEVQSLELRKTPWPEALAKFQHWGADRKFGDECDEHKCSLQITLTEPVFGYPPPTNLSALLDDYFRSRFKMSYDTGPFVRVEQRLLRAYMRVGGRPAGVFATVGMRNGIVWSKGFDVAVETYVRDVPLDVPHFFEGEWGEYVLYASANSFPRLDEDRSNSIDPQLTLHPDYLIGRPSSCEICEAGWVMFTAYADAKDVHRLLQLDLSCLTRWHPCLTQRDIMPAAWAQYVAELPRVDALRGQLACSPPVIELLGRDSANILTGEILGHRDEDDDQGYPNEFARVRVQQRIKGATNWNVGEMLDVPASLPARQEKASLLPRLPLILFGGPVTEIEKGIEVEGVCSYLPANENNLKLVRQGIDQDYSAADNPK